MKCPICKLDFPGRLIRPLTIIRAGKTSSALMCPICALKARNKPADLPFPLRAIPLRTLGAGPGDFILPIRLEANDAGSWQLAEFWEWRDGRWHREKCPEQTVTREDFEHE